MGNTTYRLFNDTISGLDSRTSLEVIIVQEGFGKRGSGVMMSPEVLFKDQALSCRRI